MPTGIAISDVRRQLFDAAERILLRAGANALTSRAVTTEAGVAKGVLHRHFEDFDAFLADLVLDRVGRIEIRSRALRESAGTGDVVGNLAAALTDLFGTIALRIVGLVIARDALRARLREAGGPGVPVLREATAMVAGYLAAERDLGRIPAGADVDLLAPTLIGAAHLLFADADGPAPGAGELRRVVATVVPAGGTDARPLMA
ncbi:TetR/AcrR family transcriptional regulator [Streptomyces pseudovenezuelae]|uniref:TetR/AcrR family transcriptional regulator n=1 Tax=Streptomyces pseudovenezuelae TaxID=67350 RepID=UPI00371937D2